MFGRHWLLRSSSTRCTRPGPEFGPRPSEPRVPPSAGAVREDVRRDDLKTHPGSDDRMTGLVVVTRTRPREDQRLTTQDIEEFEFGLDSFVPISVDESGQELSGDIVIRNTVDEAVLAMVPQDMPVAETA